MLVISPLIIVAMLFGSTVLFGSGFYAGKVFQNQAPERREVQNQTENPIETLPGIPVETATTTGQPIPLPAGNPGEAINGILPSQPCAPILPIPQQGAPVTPTMKLPVPKTTPITSTVPLPRLPGIPSIPTMPLAPFPAGPTSTPSTAFPPPPMLPGTFPTASPSLVPSMLPPPLLP